MAFHPSVLFFTRWTVSIRDWLMYIIIFYLKKTQKWRFRPPPPQKKTPDLYIYVHKSPKWFKTWYQQYMVYGVITMMKISFEYILYTYLVQQSHCPRFVWCCFWSSDNRSPRHRTATLGAAPLRTPLVSWLFHHWSVFYRTPLPCKNVYRMKINECFLFNYNMI